MPTLPGRTSGRKGQTQRKGRGKDRRRQVERARGAVGEVGTGRRGPRLDCAQLDWPRRSTNSCWSAPSLSGGPAGQLAGTPEVPPRHGRQGTHSRPEPVLTAKQSEPALTLVRNVRLVGLPAPSNCRQGSRGAKGGRLRMVPPSQPHAGMPLAHDFPACHQTEQRDQPVSSGAARHGPASAAASADLPELRFQPRHRLQYREGKCSVSAPAAVQQQRRRKQQHCGVGLLSRRQLSRSRVQGEYDAAGGGLPSAASSIRRRTRRRTRRRPSRSRDAVLCTPFLLDSLLSCKFRCQVML